MRPNRNRNSARAAARPVSERENLQRAHGILMGVLAQATLLVTALDGLGQGEPEADDCVHGGGAEHAAKAIQAQIREAQHLLERPELGDEASRIHRELFDVWSLAAVAVHALACDAPLCGQDDENISVCAYPAAAAIRVVQKSADQLTDRLDALLVKMAQPRKRAA
jgi:hypothetical protein